MYCVNSNNGDSDNFKVNSGINKAGDVLTLICIVYRPAYREFDGMSAWLTCKAQMCFGICICR